MSRLSRKEAQNYRKRARKMVYEEGVDKFLDRIDEDVLRRLIICDDYQRMPGDKVAMLHQQEGETIKRQYVSRWCGKKCLDEQD